MKRHARKDIRGTYTKRHMHEGRPKASHVICEQTDTIHIRYVRAGCRLKMSHVTGKKDSCDSKERFLTQKSHATQKKEPPCGYERAMLHEQTYTRTSLNVGKRHADQRRPM